MKIALIVLLFLMGLVSTAVGREKLKDEKEKFVGRVKAVRTKTTDFEKESGKWIATGPADEETQEFSDQPEADDADTEAQDSDEFIDEDPLKTLQSKGYNREYKSSSGEYGYCKLDKRKNVLEAAHYSSEKKLVRKDFYTYDANGNEIEKNSYKTDGTLFGKTVMIYDQKGNRVEKIRYFPDGSIEERSVWAFDTRCNVTEETRYEANTLSYRIKYSYKYDRVGNWINRVEVFENVKDNQTISEVKTVSERTITYY
ncbi:MAG: hypothetical protein WBV94_17720 [Blastocatellia bacterium]